MIIRSVSSRRVPDAKTIHSSSCLLKAFAAAFTFCVLTMTAAPSGVLAQVSNTDAFTPSSWQPGAESARRGARGDNFAASGETVRIRPSRRSNVTTTTKLDEFDLPAQPTARRAAPTAGAQVVRKRPAKRVRVAALGGTTVTDVTPRRPVQKRAQRTQVAALGGVVTPTVRAPSTSLSGGAIAWRASSGCLAGNLRTVVASVAANYGSLTVNSTCRNQRHNRRVGGARKSWHLTGNAVDFRVHRGNAGRLYAYLRGTVGGLKHYGGGRFHIDNGPRRTF